MRNRVTTFGLTAVSFLKAGLAYAQPHLSSGGFMGTGLELGGPNFLSIVKTKKVFIERCNGKFTGFHWIRKACKDPKFSGKTLVQCTQHQGTWKRIASKICAEGQSKSSYGRKAWYLNNCSGRAIGDLSTFCKIPGNENVQISECKKGRSLGSTSCERIKPWSGW